MNAVRPSSNLGRAVPQALHVGPAVGRHYSFMKGCLKGSGTWSAEAEGAEFVSHNTLTSPYGPTYSIFMRLEGLGGGGGGVLWEEPELAVDSEKVTEQWERGLC